jgi:AsmA protein
MKKFLKIFLITVFLLIIVLGGGIYFTVKKISPDLLKTKVSALVLDKTGRELVINGELQLSFFPWLGARVSDIALSSEKHFTEIPFFKAKEIDVKIKIVPLFYGKFDLGSIKVKNAELNLVKNEAGLSNWQDLTKKASPQVAEEEKVTDFPRVLPATISIPNIDFNNVNVYWQNKQTGKKIALKNLNLYLSQSTLGDSFSIIANCLFDRIDTGLNGSVDFKGKVSVDIFNQVYAVRNLSLAGKVKNRLLPKPVDYSFKTDLTVDFKKQVLSVTDARAEIGDTNLEAKFSGNNIRYAPNFKGEVKIDSLGAHDLLSLFEMKPIKGSSGWKHGSLQGSFEATSKYVKIPNLVVKLDEMILNGNGSYSFFTDRNLMFKFDANYLDLDRFLVTPKTPVAKKNDSKAIVVASDDSSWFKGLKIIGAIRVGKLKVAGLDFYNLNLDAVSSGDVLNLKPISAGFYRGNVNGTVSMVPGQEKVPVNIFGTFSNVDLQSLFGEVFHSQKFAGTGFLTINLSISGGDFSSPLSHLNGQGKLSVNNGVFYGFDVDYNIQKAKAIFAKQAIPGGDQQKTRFNSLTANFAISNGILSSSDLLVQGQSFKVIGHGSSDLARQTINFELDAYGLYQVAKEGSSFAGAKDFYLPIQVGGTFLDPSFKPNVGVLVGNVVKEVVREQLEKQLEKRGGAIIKSLQLKELKIFH